MCQEPVEAGIGTLMREPLQRKGPARETHILKNRGTQIVEEKTAAQSFHKTLDARTHAASKIGLIGIYTHKTPGLKHLKSLPSQFSSKASSTLQKKSSL
jgi:hypothetical protein